MNQINSEPAPTTAVALSAGDQTVALFSLFERAVLNPEFDVAKLEALYRMQREQVERIAKGEFFASLRAAQAEIGPIIRDGKNDQTNSRYAKYETIDDEIRPIYNRHGFTISFLSVPPEVPGNIRVQMHVAHTASERGGPGHTQIVELEAPPDTMGIKGTANKTPMHGLGSALSYLRRYLLCMFFNIVTRGEDNDGNGGGRSYGQRTTLPPRQQANATTIDHGDQRDEQRDERRERKQTVGEWLAALRGRLDAAVKAGDRKAVDDIAAEDKVQKALKTLLGDRLAELNTMIAGAIRAVAAEDGEVFYLIDQYGEVVVVVRSAVEYAKALIDLWGKAGPVAGLELVEHNADNIDAARSSPEAAKLLAGLDEQPPPKQEVGQTVGQNHEVVRPVLQRGKPSWPVWLKLFRDQLAVLPADLIGWTEAQRETLAEAPMAQRALAVRAVVEAFGKVGMPAPPWLAGMLTGSAPPSDEDEVWAARQIEAIRAIPTNASGRIAFNALAASPDVRPVMLRFRKEKPALFARLDAVFGEKHQALPQAGAEAR